MNNKLNLEAESFEFYTEYEETPELSDVFDTKLTKTSERPKSAFGTLTIITPKEYQINYTFTQDDALWLARLIVGEAGGYDNHDNHAVIWATFNRFALFTHSGSKWMQRARLRGYKTFASFIRSYSTTLQPVLYSAKAAARAITLSKKYPQKYKYIETGGVYPGTSIPKGQLEHHLKRIQKMTWNNLRKETKNVVERALRGQIDNLIGTASEFANTYTYFKQNKGRSPKNYDEWRQYTEAFARSKRWTWVGEVKNLHQIKQNAFFVDDKVKHLPKDTIRVITPKSNGEIIESSFEAEPFESYYEFDNILEYDVIVPSEVVYDVEPGRPYGPKWKNQRPPGLPEHARLTSRIGGAIPYIEKIARVHGVGEVFVTTVRHLAKTESGGMFARPANTFDARPKGQRPAGKNLITAWGAFQFNRGAWQSLPGVARSEFPWDSTPYDEINRPILNYMKLFSNIVKSGGSEIDAARGIRLWHRTPAGYALYLSRGKRSGFLVAWRQIDSSHRNIVDRHLRSASIIV